ncbi:hypothetical protein OG21DRAFT_1448321 [Imleria badia]|nr:hypothetical protein OG21DRAFT_1448321 [Imleria badia]
MIQEQDRTMDSISGTLTTLAQQAGLMGQEIGQHNEMLDDLERNVDRSDSKLNSAMRKMKKFIQDTEDTKSGWCITILIIILVVLQSLSIFMLSLVQLEYSQRRRTTIMYIVASGAVRGSITIIIMLNMLDGPIGFKIESRANQCNVYHCYCSCNSSSSYSE